MILAAVAAYVLLQLGIAAWAARGTADEDDYLVAGRTLGTLTVGLSLFATWFAAETVLATTAEVASNGLAGARADPFGYAAGLAVLGAVLAGPLRRSGVVTIADFLRRRFGPGSEGLATGVVALSGTVWAGAQLYAFSVVLAGLTGLGFGAALAAVTALVLAYTLLGGLKGDVVTDAVQGVVLAIGMVVVAALVWQRADPGAVTPDRLALLPPGEPILGQAELWLLPILGTIVSQEAVSRVLAARNEAVARRGAWLGAGLYLAVGGLPVLIGLLAPTMGLDLAEGDALLTDLAGTILPGWAHAVLVGALLSAILSSVDSALLAVSAVVTENVVLRRRPGMPARARLRAARLTTLGAGGLAVLVAVSGESLRGLVLEASAIAGILVVPVVLGVVTAWGGARAALVSMVVSGGAYAAMGWVIGVPGAYLWATAAGLAAYALTAWASARSRPTGDRSARPAR